MNTNSRSGVSRRQLLGAAITLPVMGLSTAVWADDCAWVVGAIDSVNNQLAQLDDWVKTEGPKEIANLQQRLADLQSQSTNLLATSDQADWDTAITTVGAVVESAVVIAGVLLGGEAIGGLILVGLFASVTLLVVRAAVVPTTLEPSIAVGQVVDDVQKFIDGANAAGDKALIAFETGLEVTSVALSTGHAAFDFYQAYAASEKSDDALNKFIAVSDEAARLEKLIADLAQPGNLEAYRVDQLNQSLNILNSMANGCAPGASLPSPP